MSDRATRVASRKLLEQIQLSADTWWELFATFVSGIELDDPLRHDRVKKAAELADQALEEYESRWAKRLRDQFEVATASKKTNEPRPEQR